MAERPPIPPLGMPQPVAQPRQQALIDQFQSVMPQQQAIPTIQQPQRELPTLPPWLDLSSLFGPSGALEPDIRQVIPFLLGPSGRGVSAASRAPLGQLAAGGLPELAEGAAAEGAAVEEGAGILSRGTQEAAPAAAPGVLAQGTEGTIGGRPVYLNEAGEPLSVWHGTNSDMPSEGFVFNPELIGVGTDPGHYGRGFYLSGSEGEAGYYGRNIGEFNLTWSNPLDLSNETGDLTFPGHFRSWATKLESLGALPDELSDALQSLNNAWNYVEENVRYVPMENSNLGLSGVRASVLNPAEGFADEIATSGGQFMPQTEAEALEQLRHEFISEMERFHPELFPNLGLANESLSDFIRTGNLGPEGLSEAAAAAGHDGIIYGDEYVVFNNSDIYQVPKAPATPGVLAQGTEEAAALPAPVARTDTPEFRNWFGNSQVVDEGGQPLVVYHGTDAEFDTFDPSRAQRGLLGPGFYFTTSREMAEQFGDRVVEAYLRIDNPRDNSGGGPLPPRSDEFDGAIAVGTPGTPPGERVFMVTDPTQIKSIHNEGTWDTTNPNTLKRNERPDKQALS